MYVCSSPQLIAKVCIGMRCILFTCMHQAIKMGDKGTIECWLQNEKEKVNICRGGSSYHQHIAVANGTALHWAAYYGQLEIAQLLLDNGAGRSNCYKLLIKVQTFITKQILNLVTHREECYCLAATSNMLLQQKLLNMLAKI